MTPSERNAVLEEAAKVCEMRAEGFKSLQTGKRLDWCADARYFDDAARCEGCAAAIRRLKTPEPVPVPGEWIPWEGGECPVKAGAHHEVKLRNGSIIFDKFPRYWDWSHSDEPNSHDIIAYRVVTP